MEFLERPPRYRGPNLDPSGARLRPKRLAEGVDALMAFPPPRDNSGLIVGQQGALVIDAGINPAMAHQIQQTVQRLTDWPILWLANTVYHGDHTFGNAAFPATTKIIASRQTAQSVTDLDAEKRARAQNLHGNLDAIAEVTSWRRPDVVFDDHTQLDLGGRTVQLWHFGPGNSPGDTVVWVPEARVAWTGNLLGHRRVVPMLLEGGPAVYLDTLARFKSTLEVKTIVPGHGSLARPHELAGPRSAPAQRPGHLSESRAPAHRGLSVAARPGAQAARQQQTALPVPARSTAGAGGRVRRTG